jgi:hypothetical protein
LEEEAMEGEGQGAFRAQEGRVASSRVHKADIRTRIKADIRVEGTNSNSKGDMGGRHRVKVGDIWVEWEVEEILVVEVWVEEAIWGVEGVINRVLHRTIRVGFSPLKGVRAKDLGVLLLGTAMVTTDLISPDDLNSETFFSE